MSLDQLLEQSEQLWWLKFELWGNSVVRWLAAVGAALLALLVLKVVIGFVKRRLRKFAEGTGTGWDDAIVRTLEATRSWFLLLVGVYVGSLLLDVPQRVREVTQTIAILAL